MTHQVRDKCRYHGAEYQMESKLDFPVDGVRIRELGDLEFIELCSRNFELSTACWRNYIATWEVIDNQLLLVKLDGKYQLVGGKPLVAHWFTGSFQLPQGELVGCHIELDFRLKYENAVTLRFISGNLVESYLQKDI
ncbi:hypothetical protein [Vibrio bivalvicida]|uniref:Uncharacterized protein n=1 Tax=Vibrio bivalvicida TaxID=1276888 RepID=A0ABV4MMA6_9VIBR